jgi:hypothetical protein
MTAGHDPGSYSAGHIAGEIAARLAGHDKHFADLNGNVRELRDEVHALNLGIQRLIDSAAADRATVLATAKALRDADDARRDQSETRWAPKGRVVAVVVAAAAVAAVVIAWLNLRK